MLHAASNERTIKEFPPKVCHVAASVSEVVYVTGAGSTTDGPGPPAPENLYPALIDGLLDCRGR